MKLDLQSLFGLHVHSCTHWLRPRNPLPSLLGSYTRALLVSQDRRHLFVAPPGSDPSVQYCNPRWWNNRSQVWKGRFSWAYYTVFLYIQKTTTGKPSTCGFYCKWTKVSKINTSINWIKSNFTLVDACVMVVLIDLLEQLCCLRLLFIAVARGAKVWDMCSVYCLYGFIITSILVFNPERLFWKGNANTAKRLWIPLLYLLSSIPSHCTSSTWPTPYLWETNTIHIISPEIKTNSGKV